MHCELHIGTSYLINIGRYLYASGRKNIIITNQLFIFHVDMGDSRKIRDQIIQLPKGKRTRKSKENGDKYPT